MSRHREATPVQVRRSAWANAMRAAQRDPMRETGGVLLGWRTTDGQLCVLDMVEVEDPRSGHTAYRRRHAKAEQALAAALEQHEAGSLVGYIGEWHTHPAPIGPSFVDRFEIRRISKKSNELVTLIVCVYNARSTTWYPCGLSALRGARPNPAAITVEEGTPDA